MTDFRRLQRYAKRGDIQAANRLAVEFRRVEDWPRLRKLARILIHFGSPFVVESDGVQLPLITETSAPLLMKPREVPSVLGRSGSFDLAEPVHCPLVWTEKEQRLFACDCAEHALFIFETQVPGDLRPKSAIALARSFAHGGANGTLLARARAVASASAAHAAGSAAYDAAYSAAQAASEPSRDAAAKAAWSAVRACARQASAVAAHEVYADLTINEEYLGDAVAEASNTAGETATKAVLTWQRDLLLSYLLGEQG